MKRFFNEIVIEDNILQRTNDLLSHKSIEGAITFGKFGSEQHESILIGSCTFENGNIMILTLSSGKETYFVDMTIVNQSGDILAKNEPIYDLNLGIKSLKINNTEYIVNLSRVESMVDVISYCWTENDKNSFDEEWESNCNEGDFKFSVPVFWLMNQIVNNNDIHPFGSSIDLYSNINQNDLISTWNDMYTHEEGFKVYTLAKDANLVYNTTVLNCEVCAKF